MKAPREILLTRHSGVEPKLDAVRKSVIHSNAKETPGGSAHGSKPLFYSVATLWNELVLPSRGIWSALATTWILIFGINLYERDPVSSVTGKPVTGPAIAVNWQTQQRWMNELFAERGTAPDFDRPKHTAPKPQTNAAKAIVL